MKKSWIARKDEDGPAGRFNGTDGNDTFYGYLDRDVYHGHGGRDEIYGDLGGDRLSGGRGGDIINGYRGKDRIFGGPGNDTIEGGTHKDVITGGSGADLFRFVAWPSYVDGSHLDVITDFDPSGLGEYISISIQPELEITKFSQLRAMMIQDGDDVVLSFGAVDMLVLEDVRIGQLRADDFFIE
jgi:Ca2+-binding RTX toxin-like protein